MSSRLSRVLDGLPEFFWPLCAGVVVIACFFLVMPFLDREVHGSQITASADEVVAAALTNKCVEIRVVAKVAAMAKSQYENPIMIGDLQNFKKECKDADVKIKLEKVFLK